MWRERRKSEKSVILVLKSSNCQSHERLKKGKLEDKKKVKKNLLSWEAKICKDKIVNQWKLNQKL